MDEAQYGRSPLEPFFNALAEFNRFMLAALREKNQMGNAIHELTITQVRNGYIIHEKTKSPDSGTVGYDSLVFRNIAELTIWLEERFADG